MVENEEWEEEEEEEELAAACWDTPPSLALLLSASVGVTNAPTAGNGAPASAFLSATILTCARPPAAHNASSVPVLHTAFRRPGTRDRMPIVAVVFSSAIRICRGLETV